MSDIVEVDPLPEPPNLIDDLNKGVPPLVVLDRAIGFLCHKHIMLQPVACGELGACLEVIRAALKS